MCWALHVNTRGESIHLAFDNRIVKSPQLELIHMCMLIFLPPFPFHKSPYSLWLSVKWLRRNLNGARRVCAPNMKSGRVTFPTTDTRNKELWYMYNQNAKVQVDCNLENSS